jgi:hypothetical protein
VKWGTGGECAPSHPLIFSHKSALDGGGQPCISRDEVPAYVWAPFPVFAVGANSIVIRLIGPFEFVDSRENSVDPLSNEFDSQELEIASDYTQPSWPFHGKKRDFRCIGLQECSGAVGSASELGCRSEQSVSLGRALALALAC